MKDRTGVLPITPAIPSSRVVAQRPGRMVVEFLTGLGPTTRRLDQITDNEAVLAHGTITAINLKGTDNAPRAIVTLTDQAGDSATIRVGTDRYLDLFGYLIEDTEVLIMGRVVHPLESMPAMIEAIRVRPAHPQPTTPTPVPAPSPAAARRPLALVAGGAR